MAGTVAEITFFVSLVVVIVIHEAAHFGLAKRFGIKVQEFFVGFGPRLWSFRRGETEYGVKAIPAGGYVKIAGMNPYEEIVPEEAPRTFGAKPIWQRALVIVGGPATHFVLACLAFAVWLGAVGQPTARGPLVAAVAPTLGGRPSPAASVGLRPGDRIVGVDGVVMPTVVELVHITRTHVGEPITLRVLRDGRTFVVRVTPVLSSVAGQRVGRIGVELGQARQTSGVVGSVTGAGRLVGTAVVESVRGIARLFGPDGIGRVVTLLFTNAPRRPSDVQSVVGVGRLVGEAASASRFWDLLWIFALVNVFIALLNLLPLPPFDGGHLAVLAIEKIRGRKVDLRKLVPISAVVATVFVLLFVAIVYLDITKPITLHP